VTTNGSALTPRNAAKVVAAHPFNVNVSVDAPDAEVHDYLRGSPGLFDRLSQGIRNLVAERDRQGVHFPIIIKPTINSKNFRYLPELVTWAEKMGGVLYTQPMEKWTPETTEELWVEGEDMSELERVIDQVIEMRAKGAPILTPTNILELIPDHFRGKKAPRETLPCRVGLRNFFIRSWGSVEMCHYGFGAIGDLRTQSARDIWYSPEAEKVRRETSVCEELCLVTCVSQKTILDKVKMGMRLLARREGTAEGRSSSNPLIYAAE